MTTAAGPDLFIAIATTAARVATLNLARLPPQTGVEYRIFVQCEGAEPAVAAHSAQALARDDIRVIPTDGHGAARNRNAALRQIDGAVLLFADDDLILDLNGIAALRAQIAAAPVVDFFCARLLDGVHRSPKRYAPDGTAVRWYNCGKVGTPELALRPARARAAGLRFDESFGAGTPNWLGDEYIFLCDALRAGLQGRHVAVDIGVHPADSSGLAKGAAAMAVRRKVLVRALGRWRGMPARWAFALRHRRDFPNLASFLRFL